MTTQSRALRGVGPLVTAYAVVTVLLTTVVSWAFLEAYGGGRDGRWGWRGVNGRMAGQPYSNSTI